MAGHKGSKYYDIFLKQQIHLVTREESIVLNEEGFKLLSEIRKEHSIVAAAEKMGISYRKAWNLLRSIENILGFLLVEKHRGGKAGGQSFLTQDGIELTEAYASLKRYLDNASHDAVRNFFKTINKLSDKK